MRIIFVFVKDTERRRSSKRKKWGTKAIFGAAMLDLTDDKIPILNNKKVA